MRKSGEQANFLPNDGPAYDHTKGKTFGFANLNCNEGRNQRGLRGLTSLSQPSQDKQKGKISDRFSLFLCLSDLKLRDLANI